MSQLLSESTLWVENLKRQNQLLFKISTVNEAVNTYSIHAELIINIDKTLLPSMLIKLMKEKGVSRVFVPGTADYRQIRTYRIALSVDFLTIQFIYQGKTAMPERTFCFSFEFHIVQTSNHWKNETTSINLLNHIFIPYVE